MNLRLATPLALLLLLPLAWALWRIVRARGGVLPLPDIARTALPASTWRTGALRLSRVLLGVGIALAIVALARPQREFSHTARTVDAVSIAMLLDISGSMAALDLSKAAATNAPARSRLDVVKETFARFVESRPDDLVALLTFGGYVTSLAPLTADHAALLHALGGVEIAGRAAGDDGTLLDREESLTAIGDALAMACRRLRDAPTRARIVILLTDGESNTGAVAPAEAARIAATLGICVYAIGVGREGLADFPATDPFGRTVMHRAPVSLDEELLRRIATLTGGRYFNVNSPGAIADALEAIGALETTRVTVSVNVRHEELFMRGLLPAAVLMALGLALRAGLATEFA